ncbi:hypothetical protein GBAR_LOCUS31605 [Geodia barretti]|uniref:Uncharacterized protein n=1 Tax=Geodia barretti TaxID=519541 RepID=A0AA35U0Y2_GEOBA|nr:hypothetical protein GBAR_LOCUS31605 [Geodia barretti]
MGNRGNWRTSSYVTAAFLIAYPTITSMVTPPLHSPMQHDAHFTTSSLNLCCVCSTSGARSSFLRQSSCFRAKCKVFSMRFNYCIYTKTSNL